MKLTRQAMLSAILVTSSALAIAQAPAPAPAAAPPARPRFTFWVTTSAFPDGGEVPMKYAMRGDNKLPAFEFHWNLGMNPAPTPPPDLVSYAIIFHDIETANNKGIADNLHWTAWNIPATAKGLPEGLGSGDLPDGTRNGPGLASRMNKPPSYFGPGSGPGPFHHYAFEFYALDTRIDLPATATREELLKAMDGHVIGKAAWLGRFHAQQ